MRRLAVLTLVTLLLALLVACGGRASAVPTPFPTPGPTTTPGGAGPVVLGVTDLMAAPGLYVDTLVRVTGLFRLQPILVCESETHPSPATWGLAEGGLVALAGGYDQQVRSLLPTDLTVTAEGRWRRWSGLVGCGKNAAQREVWYLDVSRIVSPSPLTQVTLTPGGPPAEGTSIAGVPATLEGTPVTIEPLPGATDEGALFPTPSFEETPEFPDLEPTQEGGDFGQTPFPTFPSEEETPFPLATTPAGTPPSGQTGTPAGTPTPGGTPSGTPGTPTPTVTGTPPTPTPTGTGAAGQVVQRGDVQEMMSDYFAATSLAAGVTDVWTIYLFDDEAIEISVVAPAPADVVLSFGPKDGQPIINRQNTSPAGVAETIRVTSLPGEGDYEVRVSIAGGTATEYAITYNTDLEYLLTFKEVLTPGSPRNGVQLPENTEHYWFFLAEEGDQVTIRLSLQGLENPYFDIYILDAEQIDGVDEGFEGDDEELVFTTTHTGLHMIRVVENSSLAMIYDLSLTIP